VAALRRMGIEEAKSNLAKQGASFTLTPTTVPIYPPIHNFTPPQ